MKHVFLAVPLLVSVCAAQTFVPVATTRRISVIARQAAALVKSIATEDSNGHTIAVKVGGRLEVYLPVSMGTGSGWYIASNDAKVLEQQGGPTLGELHPKAGLGREQMEIFVFVVKSAGTVSLRLEYKRPWEKVPPSRTWAVTVVAR